MCSQHRSEEQLRAKPERCPQRQHQLLCTHEHVSHQFEEHDKIVDAAVDKLNKPRNVETYLPHGNANAHALPDYLECRRNLAIARPKPN